MEPYNIVISVIFKNKDKINIFKANECVVCLTNKSDILLFNCGHQCEKCITHLDKPKTCLMCRKKNKTVRKI